MSEKLTAQQFQAVHDRGGKLLVSAAAGSGKTKVLVDRILTYLLDEQAPANLDDFLIITYTKAAAAELRGKIAAKLTEKMAENPENRHLQRQMQRLYLTKISTVHAFCGDILREYAYRLDLPADFRVGDENECRQLREMAMSQVLENAYESAVEDEAFRTFLDTQGLGRDDRLVPDILMKVYDSSRCHMDPSAWLDRCVQEASVAHLRDAGQTPWGEYLISDLQEYLQLQIQAIEHCAMLAERAGDMEKPAALFRDTAKQLSFLASAQSWDEIYARRELDYGRLTFSKKCTNPALAEQMKAVRSACKKGLEKKLKSFSGDSAQVLEDMRQCSAAVGAMVALVRKFEVQYDRLKQARRVLDFGDLEQRMLDLLTGSNRRQITPVATEISRRFREILVDEYQDSNAVQDAIFSALTHERQNCFMVGDVKQSIYQFRLADPGIFLEKYAAYVPAQQAEPGQGRKVLLSSNFRSGGGVIQCVNDIFCRCMSPKVGGLQYGPEEELREGLPHASIHEPEVELLALDVQESTYDEEAELVAQRIQELLDGTHFVRQGESLRPVRPEDIAILLRSPGSMGRYFIRALESRGIRCVSGGGEDLLQTEEIAVLRSLLQVILNPRQDIPLLGVLASPIFGFTADDLAALRQQDHRCCIYDTLQNSDSSKAKAFLDLLLRLRRSARMQTVSQLLENIFRQTCMDSLYGAMPGGQVRKENLQSFYKLAVDFEALGQRELGQFLGFLEAMAEKGLISAQEQGADGAVTIMSIHKSKGLEFPVVFVCGLSREFNRESVRAQVLCDQKLGLGLSAVDAKNRVRYPTIAKRAIAVKTAADSLSEEMRVLYVALTRARDRLIMTYAAGNLAGDLQELVLRMDAGNTELMCRDVVCPGQWVLMAALRRTEAGALFALGGKPENTEVSQVPWLIRVVSQPETENASVDEEKQSAIPPAWAQEIRQGLAFQYPYGAATTAPSKQTATQRKSTAKEIEAAQYAPAYRRGYQNWRKPSFLEKRMDGAAYGTAVHLCLQYLPFEKCTDAQAIGIEIHRLAEKGLLTEQQAQCVSCQQLAAFFDTDLGRKLQAGKEVLREFKFSVLEDGESYAPELSGERILLQGVVDCALMEEDGITVVDFKTDAVTEETLEDRVCLYRPQVLSYAGVMKRIFGLPIKEKLLYFFQMNRFVKISE